jgi:hypothetical protein
LECENERPNKTNCRAKAKGRTMSTLLLWVVVAALFINCCALSWRIVKLETRIQKLEERR